MDYIILLFSCIAEYLIFSDFFDAFLTIRPNFQPIRNRILIAIPFIGIYFGINTLHISYLNMLSFICLLLLYSFLYEASLKERLLYIVFLCAIFFGCEFLFVGKSKRYRKNLQTVKNILDETSVCMLYYQSC